jgi:putative oxidoreductase
MMAINVGVTDHILTSSQTCRTIGEATLDHLISSKTSWADVVMFRLRRIRFEMKVRE